MQRIFYFKVPLGWVAFPAFFIIFIGNIQHNWKRYNERDIISSISIKVEIVFTTLVLIVTLATILEWGIHPGALIFQGGLASPILLTLVISMAAFTTLYVVLLVQMVSMRNAETKKRLKESCSQLYNSIKKRNKDEEC